MVQIGGKDGDGELMKQLSDEQNVKKYIDFFCFYKTLSKVCHWSMNSMKDKHTA